MKKTNLFFLLVCEGILLLILGIVGGKLAALKDFSPTMMIGGATIRILGLSYIGYLKLTRPAQGATRVKKHPTKTENPLVRYFQTRTIRGPEPMKPFRNSFIISSVGSATVWLVGFYFKNPLLIFCGYCLVVVLSTTIILRAPTVERFNNIWDVVSHVGETLFVAGLIFVMPGNFVAIFVIWLFGGFGSTPFWKLFL